MLVDGLDGGCTASPDSAFLSTLSLELVPLVHIMSWGFLVQLLELSSLRIAWDIALLHFIYRRNHLPFSLNHQSRHQRTE